MPVGWIRYAGAHQHELELAYAIPAASSVDPPILTAEGEQLYTATIDRAVGVHTRYNRSSGVRRPVRRWIEAEATKAARRKSSVMRMASTTSADGVAGPFNVVIILLQEGAPVTRQPSRQAEPFVWERMDNDRWSTYSPTHQQMLEQAYMDADAEMIDVADGTYKVLFDQCKGRAGGRARTTHAEAQGRSATRCSLRLAGPLGRRFPRTAAAGGNEHVECTVASGAHRRVQRKPASDSSESASPAGSRGFVGCCGR